MIRFISDKNDVPKYVRQAAYGLLLDGDRIALVRTPRGHFLPGGGIEEGESHEDCIRREFVEETGLVVEVGDFFEVTSIMGKPPRQEEAFEIVGHCYFVKDTGERHPMIEDDHDLVWLDLEDARSSLWMVQQAWVMELLIGRQSDVRTLTAWNPHWTNWFYNIKVLLEDQVGEELEAIEHVGSTAIPGMLAKPVIDIDMVLKPGGDYKKIYNELKKIGYKHVGDMGIAGREVLKRDLEIEEKHPLLDGISHHLTLCTADGKELKRHRHFRDNLRRDPTLRDAYNALKLEIIDKVGPYNRPGYVKSKEEANCFFDAIHGDL